MHWYRRARSLQANWVAGLAGCMIALTTLPGNAMALQPTSQSQPAQTQPAVGLPVSMAGFSDSGEFHLYKNEDRILVCAFKWEPSGKAEVHNVLSMAGQEVKFSIRLTPDADGRFSKIDIDQPQGAASLVRDGSTIKLTFKDKTQSFPLKAETALFENFTPVFMTTAIRLYDRTKGGKQSMQVFILGQAVIESSLERTGTVERTVNGRDLTLDQFTYFFPGVDIQILADATGKVYLADVPAQRAAYVRSGFEALRTSEKADAGVSQPTLEVVEQRGVEIPMRDGTKLRTDLFLPKTDAKVPVILTRTPYKKEMSELEGRFYARRGYAVAIQDCRGRFGSPGDWEPFVNEKEDGYDTIEWLAAQPWSSGKVGMIGGSYLGWVQWWAASQNPPHLVCMIPNVSPPEPFHNFPYEYGVFFLFGGIWWADVVEQNATGDLSGTSLSAIMEKKFGRLLRDLPVIDLDKKVLGRESRFWRKWIEHNTSDDYWARANFYDSITCGLPVFHQSGWFDGDGIGSKLNYAMMKKKGFDHQKLVLGPWGHQTEATRSLGDWDFGPRAAIDLPRDYLRWFDYWLKGMDNGVASEPLVRLFAMNSNVWLEGNTYPLEPTVFEKWYVHGEKSNSSRGGGVLSREAPTAAAAPARYTYDPGDPTPYPPYRETTEEEDKKDIPAEQRKAESKAHHKNVTDSRQDILVYTTAPFEQNYTLCGPVSARLWASSSAKDTDWMMRLVLVEEDEECTVLVEGRLRARYRESMSKPSLIEPNKVYAYDLDLWQTGITIQEGQRLRVEIASATFPMFSRNLNTGGHNEKDTDFVKAEQTIFQDAERPTHVLIPMIPADFVAKADAAAKEREKK